MHCISYVGSNNNNNDSNNDIVYKQNKEPDLLPKNGAIADLNGLWCCSFANFNKNIVHCNVIFLL